jgi:hypothetical protein
MHFEISVTIGRSRKNRKSRRAERAYEEGILASARKYGWRCGEQDRLPGGEFRRENALNALGAELGFPEWVLEEFRLGYNIRYFMNWADNDLVD